MPPFFARQLGNAFRGWWREERAQHGTTTATAHLARELWGYLRDSTPERRRSRYGDMEYDWEHRVNTTSGSVGWQERLLGVFHSPYQPTDAALFREMMSSLPIDFSQFTFIDLGSGKGRTLLMASEYPFRRIVGVEILPELHHAAEENIRAFKSPVQRCGLVESICADAREFVLPQEPLVLYLFNPFPAPGLTRVLKRLSTSSQRTPQPLYVLYHNAILEDQLRGCRWLERVESKHQFALYRNQSAGAGIAKK